MYFTYEVTFSYNEVHYNLNLFNVLTECDAGQELINGVCSSCRMNYYKAEAGNHMCQKCPTNSEGVLPSGSTNCRKYIVLRLMNDGARLHTCLKHFNSID